MLERDLFTLLRQVFGRGENPYEVRGKKADMGFRLKSGRIIVVEYDGAHWHKDIGRDWRKTEMIEAEPGHIVVRLREAPLEPLRPPLDLVVPKRADGARCASLVYPHLAHLFYDELADLGLHQTVGFLTMANPPRPDDLTCYECDDYLWHVGRWLPRRRRNQNS